MYPSVSGGCVFSQQPLVFGTFGDPDCRNCAQAHVSIIDPRVQREKSDLLGWRQYRFHFKIARQCRCVGPYSEAPVYLQHCAWRTTRIQTLLGRHEKGCRRLLLTVPCRSWRWDGRTFHYGKFSGQGVFYPFYWLGLYHRRLHFCQTHERDLPLAEFSIKPVHETCRRLQIEVYFEIVPGFPGLLHCLVVLLRKLGLNVV